MKKLYWVESTAAARMQFDVEPPTMISVSTRRSMSSERSGVPKKALYFFLSMTISVGSGREVRDDLGPVRAGEIEVVAAADAGADLAMEHADVVVDRIDDVAGEEDRDAGGSRGREQPRHLVDGGKGDLAAGERIFRWSCPSRRGCRPCSIGSR